MAQKMDPLRGLNPDQSGPKEKIQNGDPRAAPNRDQRSHAKEAGGPGPSLDTAQMGGKEGQVPPLEGQVVVTHGVIPLPEGVDTSEQLPAGALDRAGMDEATGQTLNPREPKEGDDKPMSREDAKDEAKKQAVGDAADGHKAEDLGDKASVTVTDKEDGSKPKVEKVTK